MANDFSSWYAQEYGNKGAVNTAPSGAEFESWYKKKYNKQYSEMEKQRKEVAQKQAYQQQYQGFKAELMPALYKAEQAWKAQGGADADFDWESAISPILAQEKYLDVARNFKKPVDKGDDPQGYDLIAAMIGANKKEDPNLFTAADLITEYKNLTYQPVPIDPDRGAISQGYTGPSIQFADISAAEARLRELEGEKQQANADFHPRGKFNSTPGSKYDSEIARTRNDIQRQTELNRFLSYVQNPDFPALSRAKDPGKGNIFNKDATLYKYINDVGEGRAVIGFTDSGNDPYGKYALLTPEETALYNYAYAKGEGAAFLKAIDRELDRRQTEKTTQTAVDLVQSGSAGAIAANVASVPMSLVGGVGYVAASADMAFGGDINPYSPYLGPSRVASAIRGTTANEIAESTNSPILKAALPFVYQTGMSIADFVAAAPLGGTGASLVLGGSAATNAMIDVTDRGGTPEQALTVGFLAGAAEMVFERVSIESLINIANPLKRGAFILNVLRQAGVEASEEALTEIANTISDNIVMGDLSNYNVAVKTYMQQGMSEADAKAKASLDVANNIGLAAAGGALSGGVTGSFTSVMTNTPEAKAYAKQALIYEQTQKFAATVQQVGLNEDASQSVVQAYTQALQAGDTQAAAKIQSTVKTTAAKIAEVNAGVEIVQAEVMATLRPTFNAMQRAQQANDMKAFTAAIDKYNADFDVGVAKTKAAKLSAENAMSAARDSVISEASSLQDQVNTARIKAEQARQAQFQSTPPNGSDAYNVSQGRAVVNGGQQRIQEFGTVREPIPAGGVRGNASAESYGGIASSNQTNMGAHAPAGGIQTGVAGSQASGIAAQTADAGVIRAGTSGIGSAAAENAGIGARSGAVDPQTVKWGTAHNERVRQSIQGHAETVKRETGQVVSAREVAEIPAQLAKEMQNVKNIAGISSPDVFLYESDDAYANAFIDWTGGKPTIGVRVNGPVHPAAAYGHEIGHADGAILKAGMALIEKLPRADIAAYKAYRDSHISSPDNADVPRELVADMFGRYMYEMATYQPASTTFGLSSDTIGRFYDAFEQALGPQEGTGETEGELVDVVSQYATVADPEYSRAQPVPPFDAQVDQVVDEVKNNRPHSFSHVMVGPTPTVLEKVGFSPLPVMMTAEHLETTYFASGKRAGNYHGLGDIVRLLPRALENPIMIIESQTHPDTSVVVLVNLTEQNGTQIIVPVLVDGSAMYNNVQIDANVVTSMHQRSNAITKLVSEALTKEASGQVGVYYADAARSRQIANASGLQLPSWVAKGGYIHSIRESGSTVNLKHQNITHTRQFKRWFGDWISSKANASKVVDDQGRPLVVYHGTNADFSVFDSKSGVHWFGDLDYAEEMAHERKGARVEAVYLNMRKPYEVTLSPDEFSDPTRERQHIQYAKAHGYDGVIFKNDTSNPIEQSTFYVVFSSEQVKSATNNIGTFDPSNPDIRYSRVTFKDEYGIEHSYQMPEIKERNDGTYYADFSLNGERKRMEGKDKAELEQRVREIKEKQRMQTLSRSVRNLRAASDLFSRGVTSTQYFQQAGDDYDHGVARLLRGLYLRNGIAQGGALSEQAMLDLLKDADKWNDKSAVSFGRETFTRNLEDIAPTPEKGRLLVETYVTPIRQGVADMTRWMKNWAERIGALQLNTEESAMVQLLGEGRVTSDVLEIGLKFENGEPMNTAKITNAVETFRAFFDEALELANAALIRNGYKPIHGRKNYFPHIGEAVGDWQGFVNKVIKGEDTLLPTAIAGMTDIFIPGKPWFKNFQERVGDQTDYDAVRGFNQYLNGVGRVVFLTDSIQRIRQLEAAVRGKYSAGGPNGELTGKAQAQHMSNFAAELLEYGNQLAGKKTRIDRAIEQAFGRPIFAKLDWLKKRFGANAVGGNLSTALSNFIPLTQGLATLNKGDFARGLQAAVSRQVRMDGLWETSDFLMSRFGKPDDIVTKPWEKFKQGAYRTTNYLFEMVDRFTAETLVFAKYQEGIRNGLSEDTAMRAADEYAERTMAQRAIGSVPTLMNSKTLGFFTQFQLEVNNQMSAMFKDIPRMYGGDKRKFIKALVQLFIYSWLYNELMEKVVTGRRPAFDPIGVVVEAIEDYSDGKAGDATINLATNILDQLPLGQLLTGGGRVPLASALEGANPTDAIKKSLNGEDAGEAWGKFAEGILYNFLPPVGGGQARKIIGGVRDYAQGGRYYGDKLAYPIDQDGMNLIRAILFGSSATAEGKAFYQGDAKALSANQTEKYEEMVKQGIDPEDAYGFLKAMDKSGTKAGALVSIATYDGDGDGKPDFERENVKFMLTMMGYKPPSGTDIRQQAKKEADAYIAGKRKDKDLAPEKLKEAEDFYKNWMLKLMQ